MRESTKRGVALAALAGSVAMGCGSERARPPAGAATPSPRAVAIADVVRTEAGAEATVPAVVRARRRASLAARIPASVVELPFREGERVEAGGVLVRLDAAALRSAVAAAEAADQAAAADLSRMEALLGKGAATPQEREQAASRAAAARAALLAARDNLAYAVLRAPFGGNVASRPVNVGDVVSPGTTLIEVEGEGGLELQATLEADLAAAARPGLRAKALVDGQAAPLVATVRSVSPAGDPSTHRFEVRADIPSAPGLRSGLFARLVLPSPAASPRLLVPATAVFERGGLRGVFVIKEGKAHLRWVAAGATAGGQTEIRAGVEAGERVATDPAGLEDRAPVTERP